MISFITDWNSLVTAYYNLKKDFEDLKNNGEKQNYKIIENQNFLHAIGARFFNEDTCTLAYIEQKLPYVDLSPANAKKYVQKNKTRLHVIDVSMPSFEIKHTFKNYHRIQIEDLLPTLHEWERNLPLFVICEDGVRSVLAVHLLANMQFTCLTHCMGGYEFF